MPLLPDPIFERTPPQRPCGVGRWIGSCSVRNQAPEGPGGRRVEAPCHPGLGIYREGRRFDLLLRICHVGPLAFTTGKGLWILKGVKG